MSLACIKDSMRYLCFSSPSFSVVHLSTLFFFLQFLFISFSNFSCLNCFKLWHKAIPSPLKPHHIKQSSFLTAPLPKAPSQREICGAPPLCLLPVASMKSRGSHSNLGFLFFKAVPTPKQNPGDFTEVLGRREAITSPRVSLM